MKRNMESKILPHKRQNFRSRAVCVPEKNVSNILPCEKKKFANKIFLY